MEYEENKKLIDAVNLLKEHCEKNIREKECDCPFDFGDDGICSIGDLCPDAWEVPKLNRWTPEDVALAKALKDVGVKVIYRSRYTLYWDNINSCGVLPYETFNSIEDGESFSIDDIIKEAEG